MDEATENARQALQLDPVTPQTRVNYINALAYSGRYGGARDELDKAEAIWPNSEVLKDARYRLDLRYGDPHRALVTLDRGMTGDGGSATESWRKFLLARIDPALANVEAALKAFRERYRHDPGDIPGYIQALGTFGKVDEAFLVSRNPVTLDSMMASTETLFRPQMRSIYSDPRFIELADRLGLLAYWRKSRVWPDFCSDPAIRYNCRREANKLLERRRAASR
jgi:tetratricopeptide (TPR) repeat protein